MSLTADITTVDYSATITCVEYSADITTSSYVIALSGLLGGIWNDAGYWFDDQTRDETP